MKYILSLFMLVFSVSCNLTATASSTEEEQVALRTLAKYSTVFRLIPTRVSQMLQVVNAYPASDVVRRADLLQLVIQRMHDMYRITQRLQNRITEVKDGFTFRGSSPVATHCAMLNDALKKYQVTLISTLSVFDSEFVRSIKRARVEGDVGASDSDVAYKAAKAVLNHNQMDILIETMAAGGSGIGGEVADNTVRNELRELRDQVSLLSSQLQSKALLDGDRGGDEKTFAHTVSQLSAQNGDAVRAAHASLTSIHDVTEPAVKNKKYSTRQGKNNVAGVVHPVTLQERVRGAYDSLQELFFGGIKWITESIPYVGRVGEFIYGLVVTIITEAHKALTHVGTRMKEVKDVTPEGVAVAADSAWSFGTWIVESWAKIGTFVLSITQPVRTYVAAQWTALMQKSSGLDCTMRQFVCRLIESIKEYKIWLWDGTVVYDKEIQDDVVIPGKLKVLSANFQTYFWRGIGHIKKASVDGSAYLMSLKNRYFPAAPVAEDADRDDEAETDMSTPQTMTQKVVAFVDQARTVALEKITQFYTVASEYILAAKNRYFPPLVPVTQKTK